MPKIKPVMAWAVVYYGRIVPSLISRHKKNIALIHARNERHVRVRISVVPKAKRKVKK